MVRSLPVLSSPGVLRRCQRSALRRYLNIFSIIESRSIIGVVGV